MEGDVAPIIDRPSESNTGNTSSDYLRKEQEKWDAWRANEGLSRTEAKRQYIAKLIDTMHKYASTTPEARELVEELEFVWDQIKNNSQNSSGSDHSSPLQNVERSGYINNSSSGAVASSAAALDIGGNGDGSGGGRPQPMRMLSPVSQADEDELLEDEGEKFVDAPVSQIDENDLQNLSEIADDDDRGGVLRRPAQSGSRWRRKIESNLVKLTMEVAALREMLEYRRYDRDKRTLLGWVMRLSCTFLADTRIDRGYDGILR